MDAVFFSMPCIRRKPQAAGEKSIKKRTAASEQFSLEEV